MPKISWKHVAQLFGGLVMAIVIFLLCGGVARGFNFDPLELGIVIAPAVSCAVATMVLLQLFFSISDEKNNPKGDSWGFLVFVYIIGFGFIFVIEALLALPSEAIINKLYPGILIGEHARPYDAYLHLILLLILYLLFVLWDLATIRCHPSLAEKAEAKQAFKYVNLPTVISSICILALVIRAKNDESVGPFVRGVVSFHIFAAAVSYLIVQFPQILRKKD